MRMTIRGSFFTLAGIFVLCALTLLPGVAHATGLQGDAECGTKYCTPGTCTPTPQNPCIPCMTLTCTDITSGFPTTGNCVSSLPGKCLAKATGGKDGFGLDKVAQMLGGLLEKLMKGGKEGGSPPPPPTTPPQNTDSGCKQYYQVSVQTTDPCAYFVPPISASLTGAGTSGIGVSDQLLNALGGSVSNANTNTNVSDVLNQPVNATTTVSTASNPAANIFSGTTTVVNLLPGVRGDIQMFDGGATILAGTRDTASNSEIAGFYGSNSFNGQSIGVVGQLCRSRPWATGFLSNIIPPSFFDGLCSLRGYQVGMPVKTVPTVTVLQTPPQPVKPKPVATSTVSTVPAKVDIWAVPATVPLGSRTSVFWNTQGVTSCTETSPDGSFSQNSLSGGASTVALTGATVFTISCLVPDGSHVTDYVTVNLSI